VSTLPGISACWRLMHHAMKISGARNRTHDGRTLLFTLSSITGSPYSSAKTWNFNPSPKSQFYLIDSIFGVGDDFREVTSPDKFSSMSGRDATWGQHIRILWLFKIIFLFVFLFFNRATTHTREPIFAHNSSKDAVWCMENPFRDKKCVILKFGVFYSKTPLKLVEIGN